MSVLTTVEILKAQNEMLRKKLEAMQKELIAYKERNKRLEEACSIFEKNSADATEGWELLRQVLRRCSSYHLSDKIDPALFKSIRAYVEKSKT